MRFLIIAVAAAGLGLAAPGMPAAAPAAAQTLEQLDRQVAWQLELGEFSNRAVAAMGLADEAFSIVAKYNLGEIDKREALALVVEWVEARDQVLAGMRPEAERLAQGPVETVAGYEEAVDAMKPLPRNALATVEGYFEVVEDFARTAISGKPTDPNAVDAARLSVLQDYYQGLRLANQGAASVLGMDSPQRHLLGAISVNTDSIIQTLELSRQRMGATPSIYAATDIAARLEANAEAVEHAVERGELALRLQRRQVEMMRDTAPSDETRQQADLLGEMLETFPDSLANEREFAALLLQAPQRALPIRDIDVHDAYFVELESFETVRDELLTTRQRLAQQLQ